MPRKACDGGTVIKLIYVMGRGRSGSTIFSKVLGAFDKSFHVGEVRSLWDSVRAPGSLCACGVPVHDCPVWSQVLAKLDRVDRARAARWQHQVAHESRLFRLLRDPSARRWSELASYRAVQRELYAAIAEVTGCDTIIDSSKRPAYAMVVTGLPEFAPYFIHLVRDPRASAYSWRSHIQPGLTGAPVRSRGALQATVRWAVLNLGAEVVLRRHDGLRVRYEDFAAAPRDISQAVAQAAGLSTTTGAFIDERTVCLPVSHALGGNESRQSTGRTAVRDSGEWRVRQRPADRWVSSTVAAPLLGHYGYPFRP